MPLGGDLGLLEHGVEVGVVDTVDHVQLAARVLDAAEHAPLAPQALETGDFGIVEPIL